MVSLWFMVNFRLSANRMYGNIENKKKKTPSEVAKFLVRTRCNVDKMTPQQMIT